jgi:hypothetical protein
MTVRLTELQQAAMGLAFKTPPDYLPARLMRHLNGGVAVGLSVNR